MGNPALLWSRKLSNITPVYYKVSKLNKGIVRKVTKEKPDFVFFMKPVNIKPRTLKKIKKMGSKIFSWYPDDIFYKPNASTYFYKSIPLYNCHFTTKSFNISEVLEREARQAKFLSHAVDTQIHHPIKLGKNAYAKIGSWNISEDAKGIYSVLNYINYGN